MSYISSTIRCLLSKIINPIDPKTFIKDQYFYELDFEMRKCELNFKSEKEELKYEIELLKSLLIAMQNQIKENVKHLQQYEHNIHQISIIKEESRKKSFKLQEILDKKISLESKIVNCTNTIKTLKEENRILILNVKIEKNNLQILDSITHMSIIQPIISNSSLVQLIFLIYNIQILEWENNVNDLYIYLRDINKFQQDWIQFDEGQITESQLEFVQRLHKYHFSNTNQLSQHNHHYITLQYVSDSFLNFILQESEQLIRIAKNNQEIHINEKLIKEHQQHLIIQTLLYKEQKNDLRITQAELEYLNQYQFIFQKEYQKLQRKSQAYSKLEFLQSTLEEQYQNEYQKLSSIQDLHYYFCYQQIERTVAISQSVQEIHQKYQINPFYTSPSKLQILKNKFNTLQDMKGLVFLYDPQGIYHYFLQINKFQNYEKFNINTIDQIYHEKLMGQQNCHVLFNKKELLFQLIQKQQIVINLEIDQECLSELLSTYSFECYNDRELIAFNLKLKEYRSKVLNILQLNKLSKQELLYIKSLDLLCYQKFTLSSIDQELPLICASIFNRLQQQISILDIIRIFTKSNDLAFWQSNWKKQLVDWAMNYFSEEELFQIQFKKGRNIWNKFTESSKLEEEVKLAFTKLYFIFCEQLKPRDCIFNEFLLEFQNQQEQYDNDLKQFQAELEQSQQMLEALQSYDKTEEIEIQLQQKRDAQLIYHQQEINWEKQKIQYTQYENEGAILMSNILTAQRQLNDLQKQFQIKNQLKYFQVYELVYKPINDTDTYQVLELLTTLIKKKENQQSFKEVLCSYNIKKINKMKIEKLPPNFILSFEKQSDLIKRICQKINPLLKEVVDFIIKTYDKFQILSQMKELKQKINDDQANYKKLTELLKAQSDIESFQLKPSQRKIEQSEVRLQQLISQQQNWVQIEEIQHNITQSQEMSYYFSNQILKISTEMIFIKSLRKIFKQMERSSQDMITDIQFFDHFNLQFFHLSDSLQKSVDYYLATHILQKTIKFKFGIEFSKLFIKLIQNCYIIDLNPIFMNQLYKGSELYKYSNFKQQLNLLTKNDKMLANQFIEQFYFNKCFQKIIEDKIFQIGLKYCCILKFNFFISQKNIIQIISDAFKGYLMNKISISQYINEIWQKSLPLINNSSQECIILYLSMIIISVFKPQKVDLLQLNQCMTIGHVKQLEQMLELEIQNNGVSELIKKINKKFSQLGINIIYEFE